LNSLEINIAIFICCVPALRTLYRSIRQKSGSHATQQYNAPDSDKAASPKIPVDIAASQSDHASNHAPGSHEEPNLDAPDSIGEEDEDRIRSSRELPQDVEKIGQQ
jgi:hypothetical protein